MRYLFFLLGVIYQVVASGQLVIDKYNLIPSNLYVNSINIDDDNYIYVNTSGGIYRIGNIDNPPEVLLAGKNIKKVAFDQKIGPLATDGTRIYSLSNSSIFNLKDDVLINDICITKGRIYAATNNGIHIINPITKKTEVLNEQNTKLKSDIINFIYVDAKDIMWIGTAKGEVRVEDDKWKTYHSKVDVADYYENKEGMWFVGEDQMWLVDHFNREYDAGLNAELYAGRLNDFVIDSKGRLYVASDKLVRYDPYEERTITYSEDAGLLSKKCTSIACDKNDNVWIGTGGAGLYRLVFGDAAKAKFNASILIEKPISCTGGSDGVLKVTVSGGEGPYTYMWEDALIKGDRPRDLGPGIYKVTVTDKIQNQFESEIELIEPKTITVELIEATRITSPGSNDGALMIQAEGGTGELKFAWNNGKKGNTINKLRPGLYTVTVSDQNRCTTEATYEVKKEKFIPELDIASLVVGKTLRINELYFKADSTDVTVESFDVLDEILEFLTTNKNIVVEIGGHTNTIPPHEYCDKLSTERARNVAEYFYSKGISEKRLSYKGYGKRQPITNDESLQSRRKNQRVEIKILSL